jgi:hypothetical protein
VFETLAGDDEETETVPEIDSCSTVDVNVAVPVGVEVADDAAVVSPFETFVVLDVVPFDQRSDLTSPMA